MELTPVCSYCGCNLILFEHYDCYDEEDQALFLRMEIARNATESIAGLMFIN